MKIIFLDIDGVMHSVDKVGIESVSGLFEYLPLLGTVLDRCPDVSVIISSSWRDTHSLPELQALFGDYGHRVIGTTLSDVSCSRPANRFQECLAAAERHQASDWVVVDDQPGIVWGSQIPSPELARKVLWCDPVLGLATPFVAHSLIKRFS